MCQLFIGTFFSFRNFAEKLCVSWAFPLIECVAVWTLKLPVPHTDAFKTHAPQSFSADLLEFQKTSNNYLMQPNVPAKKEVHLSRDKLNFFLISGFSTAVPLFKIVALAFARNYLFHLFPLSDLFHEFFSGTLKPAKQISFGRNIGVHFPISRI